MVKESLKLELKNGLEARPAALFVQIASKFDSHISVVVNEKKVNANKSSPFNLMVNDSIHASSTSFGKEESLSLAHISTNVKNSISCEVIVVHF